MKRLARIIGAAALVAAALGGMTAPATAVAGGASLTVAIPAGQSNLTPYSAAVNAPGYGLVTLVYDTLLWHDHDNNLVPWLAEDYQLSSDGLDVEVTLRDGVRWSDGRPVTSEDVKFTYEYVKVFNHPRFTPEVKGVVDSVTTDGPRRAAFRLTRPYAAFLTAPLADVPILPAHIWANIREDYPSKKAEALLPVGSGPFKVTQFKPGTPLRLDANPSYFMTRSTLGRLNLQVVGDPAAQVTALRAGTVGALAVNLSPDAVKDLRTAPGVALVTGSDYATTTLTMNTTRAPFDNPELRRAVSGAIDVAEVAKAAADGQATPASPGFIHPDSPFHKPDLTHQFDLAKANTSLDRLGYTAKDPDGTRKSGHGKLLQFEILTDAAFPIETSAAQAVSSQLTRAGIGTRTVPLTPSAKAQREATADFDLTLNGAEPDVQDDPGRLGNLFGTGTPGNIGRWSNPTFDKTLQAQSAAIDRRDRITLIGDLQTILADQTPSIALFHRNGGYAFRSQAYSNWTYVRGKGIIDKLSFVNAVPAPPGGSAPGHTPTQLTSTILAATGTIIAITATAATLTRYRTRRTKRRQHQADLDSSRSTSSGVPRRHSRSARSPSASRPARNSTLTWVPVCSAHSRLVIHLWETTSTMP